MTDPIDLEALRGHTPGPWSAPYYDDTEGDHGWWIHNGKADSDEFAVAVTFFLNPNDEADARLIAAAPTLLAEYERLLAELTARRAMDAEVGALVAAAVRANGDHSAPHDCYATGPLTGDPHRDLVSCPGCELAAALLPFQRSDDKGDAT